MYNQKKRKHSSFLNKDTSDYYQRIDGILNERDTDSETKGALIDNMFTQLCEEAVEVCQCPQTSPIIERLVTHASCANIKSLVDVLSQDWDKLCKNRCSSHVVEKLLLVIPKFIMKKIVDFDFDSVEDTDNESYLILAIIKLSDYFLENLEPVLTHNYMSHVFRGLLQVLGGTCVEETHNIQKSRAAKQYGKRHRDENEPVSVEVRFNNYEVPPKFRQQLKCFYKKIFKLQDVGLLLIDRTSSPVIQTLLLVLHKADVDLCQKAIHKVIKYSRIRNDSDSAMVNLPPVVVDQIGSYLVQRVVSLCSEELFSELHAKLFKGKLLQLACHKCANFVLQDFIRACKWKQNFQEIVEELAECLNEVMTARCYGVLVALTDTSGKLSCQQDQIVQMLMKTLQCWEPVERQSKFATLVATCTPYDTFYRMKSEDAESNPMLKQINYHGSMLLQRLLRFSNTQLLETSLLDLIPAEIVTMSCDQFGSHVIEAVFRSETVKMKTKEGLLNKLTGTFVQLACNRNGSRSLEAVWANLEVKHKTKIATELCKQESKVKSDLFGRHVHRNFALFHFTTRKTEWTSVQKNDLRKRTMFKDFLESDKPGPPNKKKFQKAGPRKGKKFRKNKKNQN